MKTQRIAFVKPLEAHYFYENTSKDLIKLLASSNAHSGPLAFFTDYNTDIYLTKLPKAPECQSWTEGPYMGTNGHKAVKERRLRAKKNEKKLEISSVDEINWSDYQAVISIGCAIPSRIVKKYPHIVWCYYIPDPSPVFFLSKKWDALHGYNIFFTQGISSELPTSKNLAKYKKTHRIALDIPFVFMPPDIYMNLFPTTNKEGIRLESRSMQNADPAFIKKLEILCPVSNKMLQVKAYAEDITKRLYFVILDTPYQRFRGNALVEANAAGCLILAHKDFRCNNPQLIPKENLYNDNADLLNTIGKLNNSPQLRKEMYIRQNKIIADASYTLPKKAFDQILELHAESSVSIKPNQWKQHYFPIICTKLMPLFGIVNSLTAKLTGKPIQEYIAKIINKKGDMF